MQGRRRATLSGLWKRLAHCLAAVVFAGAVAAPVGADDAIETIDDFGHALAMEWGFFNLTIGGEKGPIDRASVEAAPLAISNPRPAIFKLSNVGATMQGGEPNEGGAMTRSIWLKIPSDGSAHRLVLHTFGSDIDTVIAVYTGTAVTGLTRIAGNNDFAVPGVSTTQSLVQFDAQAGVDYMIQVGSVGGAQGDISLNGFAFDPDGGLSAFLIDVGGNAIFNARSYVCKVVTCPSAKFVVHNSTTQTLDVVPSVSITGRFTTPAGFQLGPGAVAVSTFTGVATSNFAVRTETGSFGFSGQIAGVERSRAGHSIIAMVQGSPSTTLLTAVLPSSRAGAINQQVTAFATMLNAGSQPAVGCVIRSQDGAYSWTSFQETNASNVPIGTVNTPVTIAPGAARTFVFATQSQKTLIGDSTLPSGPLMECANQTVATQSLANTFAQSAAGSFPIADMIAVGATASGDGVLTMTPGGSAAFSIATVNIGKPSTITVRAIYGHPLGDAASSFFTGFVCETNSTTGACLAPPATSVTFSAALNVPHTFSAFVQAPAAPPAFSPGDRRMIVQFEQASPAGVFGQNPIQVPVGSTSVAVKAP